MIEGFKRLFKVSRPISWVNTAYPFAAAYLLLGGGFDTKFIIGTIFFLIPYNLLMYGINDVFDYESDMRNPRKGGIEGALESKQYHGMILRSSVLLALPFIAALIMLGSPSANVVLAGVLFAVVAYSIKGLRFKERPILDSITSSIHFVGPLVYALAFFNFPPEAWTYVIAFFLWGMASHAFGAVQDVIPDREGDLASIATVIGARWTVRLSVLLYVLSCALVFVGGVMGVFVAIAGALYVLNCLPYVNISDERSSDANTAWRRFIYLNLISGAVVTMTLVYAVVS